MNKNIIAELKIKDLYNEQFEFSQKRESGEKKMKTAFKVDYFTNEQNPNLHKVQIKTDISDEGGTYKLSLTTVGVFEVNDDNNENNKEILKANTVAIMFPYVRSQISLLTTQPGIKPLVIPPININNLLKEDK